MSSDFQISFTLPEKLSKCLPLDFLTAPLGAEGLWWSSPARFRPTRGSRQSLHASHGQVCTDWGPLGGVGKRRIDISSPSGLPRFPWICPWQVSTGVFGPPVTAEGESGQPAGSEVGPDGGGGRNSASVVIRGVHPFQVTLGAFGTLMEHSRVRVYGERGKIH